MVEKRSIYAIILATILIIGIGVILAKHSNSSYETKQTTTSQEGPSTSEAKLNLKNIPHKAIIYDSLAREFPDPQEVSELKKLLENLGFNVTIYYGRNATLDPLVALGKYGIAIIRAHGAYNGDPNNGKPLGTYIYTGMYVTEAEAAYGVNYIKEGLREGYYAPAVIPRPGVPLEKLPKYLAVSPKFFRDVAGEMNNTIIFFTGCYGFDDYRLANILLSKGASAYIAWTGNVTWLHSDEFLLAWARDLVKTGDPLNALTLANETVGPDPQSGSIVKIVVRSSGGEAKS
jgi:hypothetical protein